MKIRNISNKSRFEPTFIAIPEILCKPFGYLGSLIQSTTCICGALSETTVQASMVVSVFLCPFYFDISSEQTFVHQKRHPFQCPLLKTAHGHNSWLELGNSKYTGKRLPYISTCCHDSTSSTPLLAPFHCSSHWSLPNSKRFGSKIAAGGYRSAFQQSTTSRRPFIRHQRSGDHKAFD